MARDLRRPAVVGAWGMGFVAAAAVAATLPAAQLSNTDPASRAAVNTLAAAVLLPIGALIVDRFKAPALPWDVWVAWFLGLLGVAAVVSSADPSAAGVVPVGLTVAAVFGLAALVFAGRSIVFGDELASWIAVASALAAGGWLNGALFPPGPVAALHTADLLRLGSFAALLLAAGRELPRHARHLAEQSILGERRRIARDLHDGLAQELAFIATQTRVLVSRNGGSLELEQIAAASERALDESRHAISALSRLSTEPLTGALLRTVEEVAERVGAKIDFVGEDIEAAPDVTEALLRIAREAVANATRHGGAQAVTVALSNQVGVKLKITDDGCGFNPVAARGNGGFGLVSMHERAQALGGELHIRSRPGAGSEIEVVLP
jgi:signal transduction histidine kinase